MEVPASCWLRPHITPKTQRVWRRLFRPRSRVLEDAAAEDGITLLRQPEETVVHGLFTGVDYAVDDHVRKQDFEHHNAAFGAAVLAQVMPIVRSVARREQVGGLAADPGPRQDGPEREA
jgi:hypothetical protein